MRRCDTSVASHKGRLDWGEFKRCVNNYAYIYGKDGSAMQKMFNDHKGQDGLVDRAEMANLLVKYHTQYKPFTWTSDTKKGFQTMEDCIDSWNEKAKKDPRINLLKTFDIKKNTIGEYAFKRYRRRGYA